MEIILESISHAPNAGIKKLKPCQSMLVSGFMSVKVVGCYLSLSRVIVVFFVLMAPFHVRQFSKIPVLVVRRKNT
mgnify:CR=1 FL=1